LTLDGSEKRISVFAFTIAFATYLVMTRYVAPTIFPDNSIQVLVVEYIATLGFFEAVFLGVLWVYEHYLFKKLNKLLDVGGNWHQLMTIGGSQSIADGIRHGPCVIFSSPEKIALSGENNRLDNTPSSNWQSDVSELTGRELLVLYHSEGSYRQDNPMRRGTMVFEILGNPPSRLQGHWSDVIPAKNSGTIEIYRDKSAYENRLAQIRKSSSQRISTGEKKSG